MTRHHRKPRAKPITLNDYRLDRDYWKRKANDQQQTIDRLENRDYRTQSELMALRLSRDYFRDKLQHLCPHEHRDRIGGVHRCARCQLILTRTP